MAFLNVDEFWFAPRHGGHLRKSLDELYLTKNVACAGAVSKLYGTSYLPGNGCDRNAFVFAAPTHDGNGTGA